MRPWFFMSYRRGEDVVGEGGEVQEFFRALCEAVEVRLKPAERAEAVEVGILDQMYLGQGDHWPTGLGEALNTCRTFVPILTAPYWGRPFCGKEWHIFERRLTAHARGGAIPPLILPVVWVPPVGDDFPEWAMTLHSGVSTEDVAEDELRQVSDYDRWGLQWVQKRRTTTHSGAYDSIVRSMAARIIRRGREYELASLPEVPDLREVPNRFEAVGGPAAAAEPDIVDPALRASFVFVAPLRDELPEEFVPIEGRYANDWGDWRPYHPDVTDSIALMAQRQASSENLRVDWIPTDEALIESLRRAEEQKSAAIMVLDPRAVRIERYKQLLARFDSNLFGNCVVLVPWDDQERLSPSEQADLRERLGGVLRRWRRLETFFRAGAWGAPDLEREIRKALREIQALLASHRKPQRPTPIGGPTGLPSVSTSAPAAGGA